MISATETAAGAAAHYLAMPTTARPADGLGEAASAASSAVAVLTRALGAEQEAAATLAYRDALRREHHDTATNIYKPAGPPAARAGGLPVPCSTGGRR